MLTRTPVGSIVIPVHTGLCLLLPVHTRCILVNAIIVSGLMVGRDISVGRVLSVRDILRKLRNRSWRALEKLLRGRTRPVLALVRTGGMVRGHDGSSLGLGERVHGTGSSRRRRRRHHVPSRRFRVCNQRNFLYKNMKITR